MNAGARPGRGQADSTPNKKKAETAGKVAAATQAPSPEPVVEEPRAAMPSIDEEAEPAVRVRPRSARGAGAAPRHRAPARGRSAAAEPRDAVAADPALDREHVRRALTFTNDEQREACIRESFPNENHLRTALLALIELLDPNIDTRDPVIRDGDIDSLIKVVLFEERQRYEQGRNVAPRVDVVDPAPGPVGLRRATVPTPPGARRASVVPPAGRSATPAAGIEIEVDDDAIAKLR